MPKVSIYLSDDLYREAKARDLPLSALAQEAIERAVDRAQGDAWVARVRSRPPRMQHRIDTAALLSAAREDFGA